LPTLEACCAKSEGLDPITGTVFNLSEVKPAQDVVASMLSTVHKLTREAERRAKIENEPMQQLETAYSGHGLH